MSKEILSRVEARIEEEVQVRVRTKYLEFLREFRKKLEGLLPDIGFQPKLAPDLECYFYLDEPHEGMDKHLHAAVQGQLKKLADKEMADIVAKISELSTVVDAVRDAAARVEDVESRG